MATAVAANVFAVRLNRSLASSIVRAETSPAQFPSDCAVNRGFVLTVEPRENRGAVQFCLRTITEKLALGSGVLDTDGSIFTPVIIRADLHVVLRLARHVE